MFKRGASSEAVALVLPTHHPDDDHPGIDLILPDARYRTWERRERPLAIAWPPGKAPMLVAAYFDSARRSQEMRDEDQAVLAEVGRLAAAWVVR